MSENQNEIVNTDGITNAPGTANSNGVGNIETSVVLDPNVGQPNMFVTINEDGSVASDQQVAVNLVAQAAANQAAAATQSVVQPAQGGSTSMSHASTLNPSATPWIPSPMSGASFRGSQPVMNPLLERKLRLLLPKIESAVHQDLEIEPGEDVETVLYELVEGYLHEARSKIPVHEALMSRLKAVLGAAATTRDVIEASLKQASKDPETHLSAANSEVEGWFKRFVSLLDQIFNELPPAWYHPKAVDPALAKIEEVRREMDNVAQLVRKARKEAGLLGAEGSNAITGAGLQLKAPKKDASEVQASSFVHTFNGEGNPSETINRYQNWGREFAKLKKHLLEKCEDAGEEVLLLKLRFTLEGKAAKLVESIKANSPTGVEDAIERLNNRYGLSLIHI